MKPQRSKSARRTRLALQPLEDRCTPAAVSVPYIDADGDLVKVTASKPGLIAPPLDSADLQISGPDQGHLIKLDLTDPGFENSKIVVTVTKIVGDGLANVGFIDAANRDLNQVIVKGDLGKIDAGGDSGLNLLKVRSLGVRGPMSIDQDIYSSVYCKLGSLVVSGDFDGVELAVFGDLRSATIGGSMLGGTGLKSGRMLVHGNLGNVRVGGSVVGGAGDYSGEIFCNGNIANVRIGASVLGGDGLESGAIHGHGAIGNVRIGGDLRGGNRTSPEPLYGAGKIHGDSSIAKVTINGSLVAGINTSGPGIMNNCGAIVAGKSIGAIAIGGGIIGNFTHAATISALGGIVKPTSGFDVAIAKLLVRGSVDHAKILAGFTVAGLASNADASIGTVKVGGNWVASNMIAGAWNLGDDDVPGGMFPHDEDNVNFGDGHDKSQLAGDTVLIAQIKEITIGGTVFGTLNGGDHFGFVTEQFGSVRIAGQVLPLTIGPGYDERTFPNVNDVKLVEVD